MILSESGWEQFFTIFSEQEAQVAIFQHDFRVRYAETDRMGVSYYAHYFVWFEMGRAEYFRSLEVAYGQYEEKGIFLPVVEAFARYFQSTTYDDLLTIQVAVSELGKTSMKFVYRILNQAKQKVAEGHTVHAFVDRSRKPIRVPEEIRGKTQLQSLD